MKIEKEKKFKREYIPVIIAGVILVLFIILLILTINYEPNITEEDVGITEIVENEDLAIEKNESKCNDEELNELIKSAAKISATYSAQSKEIPVHYENEEENPGYSEEDVETYLYIELLIKGISKDVYLEITNNYNDDKKIIKAEDANKKGEYRYEAPTMDERVTYTVSVYANKYDCVGEVIRKVVFDTRIYNVYSDMLSCTMYPKYENCTQFVTTPLTFDEFNNGMTQYMKTHKEEAAQAEANVMNAFFEEDIVTAEDIEANDLVSNKPARKFFQKLKDNLELIIIAVVITGIGVLVVVLLMFIRRNRL